MDNPNKVIVFDTWKDIDRQLKPYFRHNHQEYSRLQLVSERRNTPANGSDNLQFTYLIGLFASDDGQFWYGGGIQDLSEYEGDKEYPTIEALAKGVKDGISDAGKSYCGAWIVPFFYTIRDVYKFSKNERKRIDDNLKILRENFLNLGSYLSEQEQDGRAASQEDFSTRGLSELECKEFGQFFSHQGQ